MNLTVIVLKDCMEGGEMLQIKGRVLTYQVHHLSRRPLMITYKILNSLKPCPKGSENNW